jgi:hypothetical protein
MDELHGIVLLSVMLVNYDPSVLLFLMVKHYVNSFVGFDTGKLQLVIYVALRPHCELTVDRTPNF